MGVNEQVSDEEGGGGGGGGGGVCVCFFQTKLQTEIIGRLFVSVTRTVVQLSHVARRRSRNREKLQSRF